MSARQFVDMDLARLEIATLANIRRLLSDLAYNSWEAGVQSGLYEPDLSREYQAKADQAKKALYEQFGIAP